MHKLALRTLIGSIALSALTGIYVLLVGGDGDLEGKVLITALSTSVLSILVMACGVALERRKLGWLPHAGMASAVAGYLLILIVIWEVGSHRVWVQCAMSLVLAGAAAALASLLSGAALARRFRWVRALGFLSDAALTIMLNLFVWDVLDPENDRFTRLTGVLAILLGAVTVAVPILHRMSSSDEASRGRPIAGGAESVRHCVVCATPVNGSPNSELRCSGCGVRFRVEFPE